MLSDEDRAWLKKLDAEFWPPKDTRTEGEKLWDRIFPEARTQPEPPKPREKLTRSEVEDIFRLVEEAPLLTVLFCSGMFGGIGVTLYEHEQYLGTGPEPLLSIAENHLPSLNDRTVYEHILGVPKRKVGKKKIPGSCDPTAWELFTKYTHSEKNRKWLEHYGIEMHFDQIYYDY